MDINMLIYDDMMYWKYSTNTLTIIILYIVFGMDLVPMFSSDWETTAFPYALHQSILSFFIVFAGGW